MSDREGDDRIDPRPLDGGVGGNIPVPPRPAPVFRVLALLAALAGVIAGLLGYDGALLILCALSAVLNAFGLLTGRGGTVWQGGTGGNIPVPPRPRPIPTLLALLAALTGVVVGLFGHDDALLVLCGASAVLTFIGLFTERAAARR